MKYLCVTVTLLILSAVSLRADFVSGSQTCPSSGVIQVSTTSYSLYQLSVTANINNTGYIHLGSNTVTTSTGAVLVAGGSFGATKPNPAVNPATLYMACTVNTDTVSWVGNR
jgi:hypothetical protein